MSKVVVILAGVSGSGKSTYISQKHPDAVVVSADKFFLKDGKYNFDGSKLQEAHNYCFRSFISALGRVADTTICIDNTNTTIAEIAPYYVAANAFGWDVSIVVLCVNALVAHARNRHNVPLSSVLRQGENLYNSMRHLPPWWKHSTITDYAYRDL